MLTVRSKTILILLDKSVEYLKKKKIKFHSNWFKFMPNYDVQRHFLQYFSYKVAKLDKKQALGNFFNRKGVFIWIKHVHVHVSKYM